ncbi:hypothetical protein Q7P37_000751 [Cladosporium fusiforme]
MAGALDAHAKPPDVMRQVYKHFQKLDPRLVDQDDGVIDTSHMDGSSHVSPSSLLQLPADIRQTFVDFAGSQAGETGDVKVYSVNAIPGLFVYPSLFPQEVQLQLLAKSLHRDLSNQEHKTNVHMFHHVKYPPDCHSYFSNSASDLIFEPKDSSVHKPMTTQQYLNKKLRWMTLGGQYDWTNKVYPDGPPPPFPADVKRLVEDLFPMKAEAAIVNLYSPGDTLSLHRDVSEECDQPLASISLGCDGIFVIGLEGENPDAAARLATLRLRSGDAVLMSGESRYAWHSVPKVLDGTCPQWMRQWPGGDYDGWQGWMERKRINLNVRQMFD